LRLIQGCTLTLTLTLTFTLTLRFVDDSHFDNDPFFQLPADADAPEV
jgi:hypothetical protein